VPAEDESDRLQEVVVTAASGAAPSAFAGHSGEHYRHGQDKIERFGMDISSTTRVKCRASNSRDLEQPAPDDIRGGRRLNLRGMSRALTAFPQLLSIRRGAYPGMDPKLFDIQRIESVRGPQGTLYAPNSMGGAVRVVMNQPVQDRFDYRGDATFKSTQFGAPSYETNGMSTCPSSG